VEPIIVVGPAAEASEENEEPISPALRDSRPTLSSKISPATIQRHGVEFGLWPSSVVVGRNLRRIRSQRPRNRGADKK